MPADLFEQHRVIQKTARDFLASLKRKPRISLDELNRSRAKLGSLLMQHQLAEQEQIFGPLLRDGIAKMPELEPIVRQIQYQKKQYSEMIRRWTPQTIAADWDGYVVALTERLKEIPNMMRTEEEHLYKPVQRMLLPTVPQAAAHARLPTENGVSRAS